MPVYYTSSLGNRIHRKSFRNCGLCEFRPHSTACADCRELKTPLPDLIDLCFLSVAQGRLGDLDERLLVEIKSADAICQGVSTRLIPPLLTHISSGRQLPFNVSERGLSPEATL